MKTKEQFAAMLNGREYGEELVEGDARVAEAAGLIVIYGASDDLIELDGVVSDEVGAYDGTTFKLTATGPLEDWDDGDKKDKAEAIAWFERDKLPSATIDAKWDHNGYSWFISADIPFAPFDIMEDGEKFCRGIVIAVSDLPKGA